MGHRSANSIASPKEIVLHSFKTVLRKINRTTFFCLWECDQSRLEIYFCSLLWLISSTSNNHTVRIPCILCAFITLHFLCSMLHAILQEISSLVFKVLYSHGVLSQKPRSISVCFDIKYISYKYNICKNIEEIDKSFGQVSWFWPCTTYKTISVPFRYLWFLI